MAIDPGVEQLAVQGAGVGAAAPAPGIRSLGTRLPHASGFSIARLKLGVRVPVAIFVGLFVAALLIPSLAPHDPFKPVGTAFQPMGSPGSLFGTDQVGRDLLTRMLYGFRSTWLWTLVIVGVGMAVGTLVGTFVGVIGGRADRWTMRLCDGLLAIPSQMLAISIVAIMGRGISHTVFALSLVWWAYFARILRAEVRSIVSRPHIEAARLAGVSKWRLVWRHVLPGMVPSLVVTTSHDFGNALMALGTLSFIGIGTPAPAPELGAMTAQGVNFLLSNWYIPVLPGMVLFALTLLLNLCGDVLRSNLVGR